MAINNRLDRRHDINKGERLPERHTRVLDEEAYRANLPEFVPQGAGKRVYTAKEIMENFPKPTKPKLDVLEAGDLVFVGGHIEEVEEVLDTENMVVRIRGVKVGGCKLLPVQMQIAWQEAKKEMGV